MSKKVAFRHRKSFEQWMTTLNLFAKSRISTNEALKQFNSLSATQRLKIKREFDEYDKIRRLKIPKEEMKNAWEISVMVDAHIIATEHDIDPLTAIMCISPCCRGNEQIFLK